MPTDRPKELFIDCLTGTEEVRELTDEEIAALPQPEAPNDAD